ncbi:hypothetical protein [Halovivax cerinus]|uniref:t-SNARE coiled-coil homology domain-containing protein n=1 Tax=Halovivax cerinus TaxID=1487865 RepID=A0ABD5NSC0_9EURY|nr:hypothetical protein [Halovivax cerinus]
MSSSADTEDIVTVNRDDVTVTKRYAPDEFPVPAIRFEISSDRPEPAAVRLTEDIPESFPMDAVGFHPEYHSDQWTAYQDHRVQFEGVVEPNESLVTVYGIRLDDELDPAAFLTEPSIEAYSEHDVVESTAADVSESVEEVVSSEGADAVKRLLSGDADSVPGLESEGAPSAESSGSDSEDESSSEIELDIDAAAERVAEETEPGDDESESDVGDRDQPSVDDDFDDTSVTTDADDSSDSRDDGVDTADSATESISAALASELRADRVDQSDLETIVDALPENAISGSTDARLNHLQQRVESVAAYANALEDFLDDNGSGAQLIDDLSTELSALRSEVESIDATADDNAAEIDDLTSSLSSTSSAVDDLDSMVAELESSVTSVSSDLSDLTTTVSSHDEAVDGIDDRVSSLESSVSDLDDRAESIESNVDDVTTDVDELAETVDSLADDLDDVSADVVDIIEWRDQLGSMFSDD